VSDKLLPNLIERLTLFGMRAAFVLTAFVFAWLLAGWAKRATLRSLDQTKLDATLTRFIANFVRYLIIIGAAVACLGAFGLQTTSFAAVLGAAGIAVGLAFQGTLSNFASGLMLLLFRPFRVGDTIRVGNNVGTVKELELFSTELATSDNRRIILPNASVFGQPLENSTYHPTRRIEIPVGFPPKIDLDRVEEAFRRAVAGTQGILSEPRPDLFVVDISGATPPGGTAPPPGTVTCQLRAWCHTPDYNALQQTVARLAKKVLDETRP